MPGSSNSKAQVKKGASKFKFIVSSLMVLGLFAIVFTILVIQIQSGVTGYLAGLSLWSRGQVETVRQINVYARTGDPAALQQARIWYQIPLGDLQARQPMEGDVFDFEAARAGLLRGGNHPDDVVRMIWLFRIFKSAPYFKDAVTAWQESDAGIIQLGEVIDGLEAAWKRQPADPAAIQILQAELDQVNHQLAGNAAEFRNKMNLASRALVTILSVTTVVFFLLLGGIATLLILKLTSAVRHSEFKFRKTFEQAAMGIAQVDDRGHILEANDALCDILKYRREDLLKLRYNQLIYKQDRNIGKEGRIAMAKGKQDTLSLKQRLCCGDGSLVWTKITMSCIEGEHPNNLRYIGILEDVSEQHRLSEKLVYQARHDDLTGLINRRAFEGYLSDALLRARSENFVHCLCFIDLDQFKIVNDTSGHYVGDQLLQQAAHLLSLHLRKSDLLARLGGDEFGLILDCCEPEAGVKLAESLRQKLVDTPFTWQDKSFRIGCSIGIVPITANSGDVAELLQAADSACHLAKEQGRNRVLLTYQGDEELAARRIQMEWLDRIRLAIDNDKLFLDAQKIVSLVPTLGDRIEVLIRMRGEQEEVIPPGAFLPAAERFGVAHLLDRWVIEEVCKHLNAHPDYLDSLDACHINVSGRSFDYNDFTDFTLNTLKKYDIPASKLCFEITETAAISNLTDVYQFMSQLRRTGSSFALDDFGAGLSSFAYLKQLPVEYLKIDGTFVRNIANDETDRAMVRAITDIGLTLGKIMVAEFVEDKQALKLLQQMGVQYAQGYHLHRPERFARIIQQDSLITSDSI